MGKLSKLFKILGFILKHADSFHEFYKCMKLKLEDGRVTPREAIECVFNLIIGILEREGYIREAQEWKRFYPKALKLLHGELEEWLREK